MSVKDSSATSKICVFCNSAEDNELEYGKIYEHNGIVTHYYCMLLSSNMAQKGKDDEGILGFLAEDIQKELRRGKRLVCIYCKKTGATLVCCNARCKRIFHLPCGLKNGSLHQYFNRFKSYCINHRPKQKIEDKILKEIRSVDNALCYICYDKVNVDELINTLWAPCCRKAWFHRNCIQQLALSLGYYFKCPLCNNKTDFEKSMKEYGVYVPSQDASWELVPNAFEELLYRHNQCDASKCLCPKGRKHTSNNAKWELTLCQMCGSQGIHKACGQLQWANPAWTCHECTSMLNNSDQNERDERDERDEPTRLGNNSATDKSANRDSDQCSNANSNSNSVSDSDSDSDSDSKSKSKSNSDSDSDFHIDSGSDLDSDSDISVGTNSPIKYSLSDDLSSTSSMNNIVELKLRPGPRSFKLKQQIDKLEKCRLDLTTNTERNVITEASPKDTNKSSSNNNNEEKESSTSEKNISQQQSTNDSSQIKRESSKNDEKSQPIQKETDVIIIESDDDDVQLIGLKPKIYAPFFVQSQKSNSLCISGVSTSKQTTKSPLNAIKNSASSQNLMIADLWKNNINVPEPIISESEASNKNKSAISNQIDVATLRKSTLDIGTLGSNDLEEMDGVDANETSVMNIKILDVISVPPEVFENISVSPNVCDNVTLRKNTTDVSSSSANEMSPLFAKLNEEFPSAKRSLPEASSSTDNCKKMKRNSFDETSSRQIITAHNTNNTNDTNQQNKSTSANKSSEISKNDEETSKCSCQITNNISKPLLNNRTENLFTQYMSNLSKTGDMNQILSNLEGNGVSVNVQQNKENSVVHSTDYITLGKNSQMFLQIPINGFNVQQIPNPKFAAISQNATMDKPNMNAIPSNRIILPKMTDNITVLVDQPMMANVTPPILNNNRRMAIINQQETVSQGNVSPNKSSAGNNSSNTSHCDGDAGTRPIETDSRKQDDLSSGNRTSATDTEEIASQSSGTTQSVFPHVTNNRNTCHQPRLIPRYMNLRDLKFQICESNIQMTLYDMFSVSIPMKNSKESKNQSTGIRSASWKSKELSILASREASCSSDHIDNIPIERQRPDKLPRSSKICSINGKNTCAKYGQDDAKENLDPIRSRMLSCSGTIDNVNSTNNVDDAVNDRFCDENDSETRFVSSDTNLSVLNPTVCNMNVDNITDSVMLVPNSCNQGLQVNSENVQQHKAFARSLISAPAEERPGGRLFSKETSRIVSSIDFDLNIVNMNKNVEKVSQDNITVLTKQYIDGDTINNDHTDNSPTLRNDYKPLDSTNVIKPKINNRNIVRVARFNKYHVLNKQIDDSRKCIRCIPFQDNIRNSETGTKKNELCFKVSVDLCRIQNLIDSKPELFENRKCDNNDQRYKRDYARQQIRYNIESNDSINNCSHKSKDVQKSNYMCNVEHTHMQRNSYGADTFPRCQKSHQEIRDFDKDILDR